MAEPIGALRVEMSANAAQLSADLGRAHAAVRTFAARSRVAMDSLEKSFGRLERAAMRYAKYAVAAAAAGAAYGFARLTKEAIATADALYDTAQIVGTSAENLSKLQYAARISGVEAEALTKGLTFLNRTLVDAATGGKKGTEALTSLGMQLADVTDSAGKLLPLDQALGKIADRFAALPNEAPKATAAVNLFSRAGAGLIPMLNLGSAGMQQLGDQASRLGLVISNDLAARANLLGDELEAMRGGLMGVGVVIAEHILPRLAALTSAFLAATDAGKGFWASLAAGAKAAILGTELEQQRHVLLMMQTDLGKWQSGTISFLESMTWWAKWGFSLEGFEKRVKEQMDLVDQLEAKQRAARATMAGVVVPPAAGKSWEQILADLDALDDKPDLQKDKVTAAERAAQQALEAGEQAIEQLLRERDIREGSSHVEQLAFELEAGHLVALNALRAEGTAQEREKADATVRRLEALAQELDLRDLILGIETATAARLEDNATRAAQIVDEGLSEADRLRAQLEDLERLNPANWRLPTSLLVGGGLGSEVPLEEAQYEAAKKRLQMMLDAAEAAERYEAETRRITAAVAAGTMTHEQYDAAIAVTGLTMDETAARIIEQWALVDAAFEDWSRRATDTLVRFCMTGKLSFGDFARSVIADLLRIQIQAEMTDLFAGLRAGSIGRFVTGIIAPSVGAAAAGVGATTTGTITTGGGYLPPPLLKVAAPEVELPALKIAAAAPEFDFGTVLAAGLRELSVPVPAWPEAEVGAREPAAVQPPQSIRIVNVLDPEVVSDWGASPAGEKIILNAIAKHATQLRTLLR